MAELVESRAPKANPEHPTLKKIDQLASRQEVYFREPTPPTKKQLENLGFKVPEQDPLAVRAVVFEAKKTAETEKDGKDPIAVFYEPGAEGTSASAAPIAAELMMQSNFSDAKVTVAVGLSQPASTDVVMGLGDYPTDAKKRAVDLAAFVSEIVNNARDLPKEVYLIGTSMAGIDTVEAAPILDELFKAKGLDTKVGGIILNQSGGMYDQNPVSFLTQSVPRHTSFVDESRILFPTFEDLADVETSIELAKEKGDKPLEMQRKAQLERMKENQSKRPYSHLMTDQEKQRFDQIEKALNGSVDKKNAVIWEQAPTGGLIDRPVKVDDLLKERAAITKKVVGNIYAAADKNPQAFAPLAYANIFDPRQGEGVINNLTVLTTQSEVARDKITVPTAILMAEKEAYFEYMKFSNQEQNMKMEGKGRMFKNAREYVGKIIGWSHNAAMVEPDRFGKIVGSVIERMRRDQKSETPKDAEVHLTL